MLIQMLVIECAALNEYFSTGLGAFGPSALRIVRLPGARKDRAAMQVRRDPCVSEGTPSRPSQGTSRTATIWAAATSLPFLLHSSLICAFKRRNHYGTQRNFLRSCGHSLQRSGFHRGARGLSRTCSFTPPKTATLTHRCPDQLPMAV